MCFTWQQTLLIVFLTVISGADYEKMMRDTFKAYMKAKLGVSPQATGGGGASDGSAATASKTTEKPIETRPAGEQ